MATTLTIPSSAIARQFQALLTEEKDVPTFFDEFRALPKSDEAKVKYNHAYVFLSTAAFASSAIAFKFLQKHREPVAVVLACIGLFFAVVFYAAKENVPTEKCAKMRIRFKEFCDPLIKALNDGRVVKTDLLERLICGPKNKPNNYDTLKQIENCVQDCTNAYDTGSESDLRRFFNQDSSDAEAVTKKVKDYQEALPLVGNYLDPKFQEKIPKNLDSEVQTGLNVLKQTATSFLYGYDKPADKDNKNAKLYVNATLNKEGTAKVESWIKA